MLPQLLVLVIAALPVISPFVIDHSETLKRVPDRFVHPGVLLDNAQLDLVKSKVAQGAQPWSNAYTAMLADPLASLSRTPSPTMVVQCGPTSRPNIGCTAERQDALAAYAMSIAWYISESTQYAQKAISYMNAWAQTIQGHNNSNAPLQTGWSGASWARAAEIIRYSNAGWDQNDIAAFKNMLRKVYLPEVIVGSNNNGNWELVMMEAAVGISVFLDDRKSYDQAMEKYLGRVPAYVYLSQDGSYPKAAPGSGLTTEAEIIKYWQGQSTFVNGLSQETCRDFTHTGYGISSISHVAEISRIQGNDLYKGDVGARLRCALEFHSQYELGAAVPSWLCNGVVNKGLGPVTEVGFNAMHTRLGNGMPNTEKLTLQQQPAGTDILFVGWETLTHANNTA